MKLFGLGRALAALSFFTPHIVLPASALELDPTNPENVRDVAKKVADDLVAMYAHVNFDGKGGNKVLSGIPGLLTYEPYYWWEAGAMFGQLVEYWYYTNDSSYNDLVKEGMLHQIGEQKNLMPRNQSKDEGNDDQIFWAFTMMSAAELNFPNPPASEPGWLALAQGVFNQLHSRWDTEKCGGGLRWQIYYYNPGWDYKNTASNGGYFHLGARLAVYTKNDTYAKEAEKAYDWMDQGPLLNEKGEVFDGSDVLKGCTDADQTAWTYNYGIMIAGTAYMYNYTNGDAKWGDRLQKFLNQTDRFFPKQNNSTMTEVCEAHALCDVDQVSFKAYLSRWLALTTQLAPFTRAQILPLLAHSGVAAAQTCVGETQSTGPSARPTRNLCGNRWYEQGYDGRGGVGQQMSALSIIGANLIQEVKGPATEGGGGTSAGNPGLGGDDAEPPIYDYDQITAADRAGASILTMLVVGATLGGGWWLVN
ncbi:glycoside hydrolase [Massariosphaeria phaeospora]|uniref:Mannan endo-1,6-alpha-mannosidase n=1 Tax=Massariosphaeria phaeospora TaxID=100035 RepID=A0A7C8M4H4_9PLEO|nr:glycoside hydrolase [Massariosphaeria phaeospora]